MIKESVKRAIREGDTILAGATRAYQQGDKERGDMLLGDVEGRANQNMAKINAAKGAYN